MRRIFFLLIAFGCTLSLSANEFNITGVYPSHWWTGMKNPKLQVMIYGPNISENSFTVHHPGVQLVKVHKAENPNYVFLDLLVSTAAKPGRAKIHFQNPNGKGTIEYELKPRRKGKGTAYAQGITSSDFIYLLMPDRFSNGDYSNDKVARYKDQSLNRDSMYHRHGGDLQGVINRLDYLRDLGVTTVWMTPVLENDMPNRTEHGYAATDHYKIDERFGGNTAYKKLSDELHKRGMKLVQDAVYNHVGLHHFFVQDPPMKDWLHQWPVFTKTTYKDQPLFDPYSAAADRKLMADGWFTEQMPDLNQDNPFVASFLIQHAIWSVEEFGVDGWRIDTYPYNDLKFMNLCNKALMDEYPRMTMFGETWVHGVLNQAFFTRNKIQGIFKSNLPGVTDFQTNLYGIVPALTENFGWTEGVNKLYATLTQDFVYQDPMKNVIFLDNHDKSRIFSVVGEDTAKHKMALGWLLTARGIPQMYYGTEILLKGISHPDGLVRGDFIGGWKEDSASRFTAAGRTATENSIYNYTRRLANFRKQSSAIKTGRFMQYVPEDWVYTYFRYDDRQTVMIVMNTSSDNRTIDPARFKERTQGFTSAKDIQNGNLHSLQKQWEMPGKTLWVLELGK